METDVLLILKKAMVTQAAINETFIRSWQFTKTLQKHTYKHFTQKWKHQQVRKMDRASSNNQVGISALSYT